MEKNNAVNDKNKYSENITLVNRQNLKLEGIVEIKSSSDTNLNLKLKDTTLNINGQDLNIKKLDIESGTLEVDGTIDCIKYGKSGNVLKRIFK
jgi:sporulation protein YabP